LEARGFHKPDDAGSIPATATKRRGQAPFRYEAMPDPFPSAQKGLAQFRPCRPKLSQTL
jgi:hypothetical protein